MEKEQPQKSKSTHIAIQILGIICLLAGVFMLITPGPGWLLIIIGVLLLGEESPLGRWIISKLPHPVRQEIRKRRNKE
jgi:uncharacterized membrane protein HdeD (DUF308 family)